METSLSDLDNQKLCHEAEIIKQKDYNFQMHLYCSY